MKDKHNLSDIAQELTNTIHDSDKTPEHYQSISQKDVIDFCNDYKLNFSKGNIIKYVARSGKKNGESELKDLNKALDYLNREIKFKQTLK